MQEFEELFYKDPYCQQFEAVVLDCQPIKNGYGIRLSDTAFYPEGGGQPADYGYLDDIEVFDVKRKEEGIIHYTHAPIEIGKTVKGQIDWARRFDHMQQHSGEHIFSGIVHQLFGYDNIGFHLGNDMITLDFSGPLSWKDVLKVETLANQIIYKNEEILEFYPTEQQLQQLDFRSKKELKGAVRIIEIPDADVCACCGTHVKQTGEIGLIKAFSAINKGEGSRVTILCGYRALNYLQGIYDEAKAISVRLAAKPLEIDQAVDHLQKTITEQKNTLFQLQRTHYDAILNSYPLGNGFIGIYEENGDSNELRKLADEMVSQGKCDICGCFNQMSNSVNYVIVSHNTNLRPLIKEINSRMNGRGGGSEQMLQGSCKANRQEIEQVMADLFK